MYSGKKISNVEFNPTRNNEIMKKNSSIEGIEYDPYAKLAFSLFCTQKLFCPHYYNGMCFFYQKDICLKKNQIPSVKKNLENFILPFGWNGLIKKGWFWGRCEVTPVSTTITPPEKTYTLKFVCLILYENFKSVGGLSTKYALLTKEKPKKKDN